MPRGHGIRARTRDMLSKSFRKNGVIPMTTYLRTFKIGDYVDIKADPAIQSGMPYKVYHGRTGIIWNVTKRAVGVEVNKQARTRMLLFPPPCGGAPCAVESAARRVEWWVGCWRLSASGTARWMRACGAGSAVAPRWGFGMEGGGARHRKPHDGHGWLEIGRRWPLRMQGVDCALAAVEGRMGRPPLQEQGSRRGARSSGRTRIYGPQRPFTRVCRSLPGAHARTLSR